MSSTSRCSASTIVTSSPGTKELRGTFVAPLGLSAYNLVNFVGGHVIYSICAPIALVEGFRPCAHRDAWLTKRTLALTAAFYVATSALILHDSRTSQTSHASSLQVLGSIAAIVLIILGAIAAGRRRRVVSSQPTTTPRTVFLVALGLALAYQLASATWPGFALAAAALVLGGMLTHRASGLRGWTLQHVVAIAAATVLTRAVLAFTYFPVIGDVSAMRKYSHNLVLGTGIAAICALASRASRVHPAPAHPE